MDERHLGGQPLRGGFLRALGIALAAAVLVSGCGPSAPTASSEPAVATSDAAPTPAPAPAFDQSTLLRADPTLANPKQTQGDLFFESTLPKQDQDADYVGAAALVVKHVAEALQANRDSLPSGPTSVSFLLLRPDLDRLGNQGAHSFMTASFPVNDLASAHLDRLGAFGTLNLSSDVQVVLPWNQAIGQWCEMHNAAPDFCQQARGSVAPEYQDAWGQP